MSLVTVRPNSTIQNGDIVIYPSGTANAVLSDNSIGTDIQFTGATPMILGFPTPTIPAGSRTIYAGVRASSLTFASGPVTISTVANPPGGGSQNSALYWYAATETSIFNAFYTGAVVSPTVSIAQTGLPPGGGAALLYELYLDVSYVVQPVAIVGLPAAGDVTDTNVPEIAWVMVLDGPGSAAVFAMDAFEVKIFDSVTYGGGGFNPATSTPIDQSGVRTDGVVVSSIVGPGSKWTGTVTLPNATYKAYVRVAQTVNGSYFWSEWAGGPAFNINVPLPPDPGIDVAPDDSNARIGLSLTPGAGIGTSWLELQRSRDAGVTWEPVRTTSGSDGIILPNQRAATLTDLKNAIKDLGPSLYWPLDLADGATDLSGNGRNGTGVGGLSIGASGGLTAVTGDSSTLFDGVNDKITSTYSPFTTGSILTVIGLASRSSHSTVDPLFSSADAKVTNLLASGSQNVVFYPNTFAGNVSTYTAFWPGDNIHVFWVWEFNEGADTTYSYVNGNWTGAINAGNYSGVTTFQLGTDNGANWFGGTLSHVAVFTRAVTTGEIASLQNLITSGQSSYF